MDFILRWPMPCWNSLRKSAMARPSILDSSVESSSPMVRAIDLCPFQSAVDLFCHCIHSGAGARNKDWISCNCCCFPKLGVPPSLAQSVVGCVPAELSCNTVWLLSSSGAWPEWRRCLCEGPHIVCVQRVLWEPVPGRHGALLHKGKHRVPATEPRHRIHEKG